MTTATAPPRLQGDVAMWIIVVAEMLSFGALFFAFALARLNDPDLFAAGQQQLDASLGAVNTALLLSGSWCVARGVAALQSGSLGAGARWTGAAAACGLGFIGVKLSEYAARLAQGQDLEAGPFFTFYWLLTGFHFLHVVAATAVLAAIAWRVPRRRWGPGDVHAPETAAALWHMVDLLWVVLFPLVYLLR